jgi:hypothetical protein
LRARINLLSSFKPGSNFLDFIKAIDCRSIEDMLCLKKFCEAASSFELPVYTESGRSKFEYILKIGGRLSSAIGRNPVDRPAQPEPDAKEAERLGILELRLHESVPDTVASVSRPRYFMPLGEVYRASRSSYKTEEVQSTNFFVLMDVTSPKKSIWLMFRYERPFVGRDGPGWEPVSFDLKPLFGPRIFDMVCLLEDVRDWAGPEQDMVDMDRLTAMLPDHTMHLKPDLFLPVLADLKKELDKGWDKPDEDEIMVVVE